MGDGALLKSVAMAIFTSVGRRLLLFVIHSLLLRWLQQPETNTLHHSHHLVVIYVGGYVLERTVTGNNSLSHSIGVLSFLMMLLTARGKAF